MSDKALAESLNSLTDRLVQMDVVDTDDIATLRAATAVLRTPDRVEVVEQQTLVRKSPTAPDGWSWQDIGPFTGYYSGIRLQKGEPIIEQDGHHLQIRQAEVSFSQRQQPIYEQLSSLMLPVSSIEASDFPTNGELPSAATGKPPYNFFPALDVLVVHGFQGDRQAMTWFRYGKQRPTRVIQGPEEITAAILDWLKWAHAHPLIPRKQPERPPRQQRLQ